MHGAKTCITEMIYLTATHGMQFLVSSKQKISHLYSLPF